MVYTVTLNPAIDYTVWLDNLKYGSVNRTQKEKISVGGKGINVSVILNRLEIPTTALGFIAGFTGEAIKNGIEKEGILHDFHRLDEGVSRINIKLKADVETDINSRGPIIDRYCVEMLFKKLDAVKNGDVVVLAGAIPFGAEENIYEKILHRLSNRDILIVVDSTKDTLLNTLKFSPFLIKPNNFELGELFGVEIKTDDEIIFYAKKLREKGAKNVLVSLAQNGSILLTENGKIIKQGIAHGKVVNSVGSGDSMVAGFLAGYLKTGDFHYALKLGTAAGSATAFSEELADKKLIHDTFQKLNEV